MGQHGGRNVYGRGLYVGGEVGEKVAATDAKLKDLVPAGAQLLPQSLTPEGGFLSVVFGWVEEGPKMC